jgi:hypothetical protein
LRKKNSRWGAWPWAVSLCVLIAGSVLSSARAQDLSALLGRTNGEGQDTYAWQMEYRAPLFPFIDASFSYLNEGHLFHHQRDGGVVQLWAVTPRWRDRLDFAFGVGPYVYFDTQFVDGPPWYRNYHSVAEIYTGSLTYYATENWFVRLNLSEIHAPGNVDTRLVLLGIGFRPSASGESSELETSSGLNQLEAFAGQTSENNYYTSYDNESSVSFGLEYRRALTSHVELSAAWLSEADGVSGRRNGALGEIWLVSTLSRRFSVGIGAGPYYALQPYRGDDGLQAARLAGVVSMTAAWQLRRSLSARVSWHRGFTHDDQDRDIITVGLAWSWGS